MKQIQQQQSRLLFAARSLLTPANAGYKTVVRREFNENYMQEQRAYE